MRKYICAAAVLALTVTLFAGCSSNKSKRVDPDKLGLGLEGLGDETQYVLNQCIDTALGEKAHQVCESDVDESARDIITKDSIAGNYWHVVGLGQEDKIVSIEQYGMVHAELLDQVNFQMTLPLVGDAVVENPAGVSVTGEFYVTDGVLYIYDADNTDAPFISAEIDENGIICFPYGSKVRIYIAPGERTFTSYKEYQAGLGASLSSENAEGETVTE